MKKKLVLSFANALIALSLGGLGVAAHAQDAKPGDVAAGEKKIAMCEGCHNLPRYQASFPEIYTLSLHDALPIFALDEQRSLERRRRVDGEHQIGCGDVGLGALELHRG